MAPLQTSSLSHSTTLDGGQTAEARDAAAESGEASDDTTPRPGPADPAQRTQEALSAPAIPRSQSDTRASDFDTHVADSHPPDVSIPPRTSQSQKSVSFSTGTSLPKPERRGSYSVFGGGGRGSWQQDGQSHPEEMNGEVDGGSSSADEGTAIMKKQRGGGNNYGAVAEEHDHDQDHQQKGQQDDMAAANGLHDGTASQQRGTVKKRKSNTGHERDAQRTTREGQAQGQPVLDGQEEGDTRWTRFLEKYGSVELENKGSVARDHLALERTFLAWLRTSLSFASIGIAVTQLFRLNTSLSNVKDPNDNDKATTLTSSPRPKNPTLLDALLFTQQHQQDDSEGGISPVDTHRLRHVGKPLGATFLGIAILILLLGFHRYFESQHYVIRGKFPASRGTILLVSFVAAGLICASLAVVLTVNPHMVES